jgi:anti-anti-sigma factor
VLLRTPAARPVMAGSDQRCLSNASAINCAKQDRSSGASGGTVVLRDTYPVRWAGRQAVVTLPGHIGASSARQIREELLAVISRGAETVIADMTATTSCDHAGANAVVRACQQAVVSGAELRLAVTSRSAGRVPGFGGLDGLVSNFPHTVLPRSLM